MIAPMNQVRTQKKTKLPCELFGFQRNQKTKEARESEMQSNKEISDQHEEWIENAQT